jgi:hypothetical protein
VVQEKISYKGVSFRIGQNLTNEVPVMVKDKKLLNGPQFDYDDTCHEIEALIEGIPPDKLKRKPRTVTQTSVIFSDTFQD